jgi:LysR family transcriptional regulator (chromosome initiation inhibitor)
MLDRYQLEAFAEVLEQQSFERAAVALRLTKGAVSQRIKSLEETLSTVLLVRSKPMVPTAVGEILLRHVKTLRLLEHEVYTAASAKPALRNNVSVSIAVDADSLATWFRNLSSAMLDQFPIVLEVLVENPGHTCSLLMRGDVVGCVSTEAKASPGFSAVYLGDLGYRCVATPKFAASHFPHGLVLSAALSAPVILLDRKDSLHDRFINMLFGITSSKGVRHYFSSPNALLDTIVAGRGYGVVPAEKAQPWLEQGALVDLAPAMPLMMPLYWHHWKTESGVVRSVTELVIRAGRDALQTRNDTDGTNLFSSSVTSHAE